jgi:hypothetical protein
MTSSGAFPEGARAVIRSEFSLDHLGALGGGQVGRLIRRALRQVAGAHLRWSRGAGAPVEVARSPDGATVRESGLADGDVVVTDGHLLFKNGARMSAHQRKAGV